MLTVFASDILRVGAHGFGLAPISARPRRRNRFHSLYRRRPTPLSGRSCSSRHFLRRGVGSLGLSPSFAIALLLMTFVGAVDTIWASSRGTIMPMLTPERLRGRSWGFFNSATGASTRSAKSKPGLFIPVVGARAATALGRLMVSAVTLATALKLSELPRFRLDMPRHKPKRGEALSGGLE